MIEIKGNNICTKCGCKIEGGYCECYNSVGNVEVEGITVKCADGTTLEVIKGYLISIDDECGSSCIKFNV